MLGHILQYYNVIASCYQQFKDLVRAGLYCIQFNSGSLILTIDTLSYLM